MATEIEMQAVVAEAVFSAAHLLEIPDQILSQILSPNSDKNLDDIVLTYQSDSYNNALLFIRVFDSLYAIVGNKKTASEWLRSHNTGLGNVPIKMINTNDGLVKVVAYLDAFRAKV
ncbi:MAG: MbcA/ParS/Xre antitoxin family protein [Candidatus Pacebacteria bacterium]|nr:MbcA/ParS/Xre antitoxin family protein [Candidatus Paceibacterota bacterium]